MKLSLRLLSSTLVLGAALNFQAVSASTGLVTSSQQQDNCIDTIYTEQSMRVVFLPGSTSRKFRIGIETTKKCDVNIQVINNQGMVVYSDVVRKVSKKVEERDFSWLKKGEYTVKVINSDSEFVKTLVI